VVNNSTEEINQADLLERHIVIIFWCRGVVSIIIGCELSIFSFWIQEDKAVYNNFCGKLFYSTRILSFTSSQSSFDIDSFSFVQVFTKYFGSLTVGYASMILSVFHHIPVLVFKLSVGSDGKVNNWCTGRFDSFHL
jgi:hypothetical protein